MFRLEATLIPTRAARPWRCGWSLDRGIDFIVRAPTQQGMAPAPEPAGRTVACEPASFLEADDLLPPGTSVVRRHVSLAAGEAMVRDTPDLPLTRAWSRTARKVPRS